jgi:plasmid stabilization system protein ParE
LRRAASPGEAPILSGPAISDTQPARHVLFYRARRRGGIEIVRILHRRMDFERQL